MRWPLQLLLTAFLLTAGPNSAGASTANVWAAVRLTQCNATCHLGSEVFNTDGIQGVSFGCYPTNSTNLRRLAGTKFFLAVSAAGQLPSANCADAIPMDAPTSIHCRRAIGPSCSGSDAAKFSWQLDIQAAATATCKPSASEAAATATCGQPGFIALSLRCQRWHSLQPPAPSTASIVDDSQCLNMGWPRPDPPSVPCRRLEDCRPVWKAGPWGACTRDCGLGEMARTVECSRLVDTPTDGPAYAPEPGMCPDGEARPHSREYCVVHPECPPYYRLRPGKCLPAFSATAAQSSRWCNDTGLRPTNAECVQLVGDATAGLNQTRRRSAADCRVQARPPLFQRCRVDDETLAQRGIACVDPGAVEPPQLLADPPGSLLVQMERLPEMAARCGQSVLLIPGTRLRLHCGVANYKADDLHWRKVGRKRDFRPEGVVKKATGGGEGPARSKAGGHCGRICVSHGELVFRRFKPRDAGTYEVTAGAAKATVRLSWHTAYDAFLTAYLPRAHLFRRLSSSAGLSPSRAASATGVDGWPAEQPALLARDVLAWMTGPWSECPCDDVDGVRQRRRTVRCERLRSGTYLVVADGLCARQLGAVPLAVEGCESSCPGWQIGHWDGECPVSRCYLRNVSLELRAVTCHDGSENATLSDSECRLSRVPKPEAARQCHNAACQPEWSTGAWSTCSISCGAFGLRTRQVRCLWRGSGLPAGLACEHLALPRGYKSCYEGPCHLLGCVDLSPVCKVYQASALCAHPSLRRSCCATCNTYQLEVYRSLKRT